MSETIDCHAVAAHGDGKKGNHAVEKTSRPESFYARNNYFMEGDVVWVRPAKLPYWPAQVICSDERRNRVRARLIDPPHSSLLLANLCRERRVCAQYAATVGAQEAARRAMSCKTSDTSMAKNACTTEKATAAAAHPSGTLARPLSCLATRKKGSDGRLSSRARTEAASCLVREDTTVLDGVVRVNSMTVPATCPDSPCQQLDQQQQEDDSGDSTFSTSLSGCCWTSVDAAMVTTGGQSVYFFDKLRTVVEIQTCIEERLQRRCHDVSAYETDFHSAVHRANRLVRVALDPNRMLPYTVCAVGVVHSLMRSHVSAPRQPHTDTFIPQTAVIRLRRGLENALRDLQGFDYIWVLFQFSYSAPGATGEGQQCIAQLHQSERPECSTTAARPDSRVGQSVVVDGLMFSHTTQCSTGTEDANKSLSSSGIAAQLSQHMATGSDDVNEILSTWRRRQGVTSSSGYKVMLVPPRDDEVRGVFATRSPHRPNFIGMSCVRLVSVHGLEVHIADHDLLHGTPVLDIKPYLPFCDSHPHARTGWVGKLEAAGKGKGDHKSSTQVKRVDRVMTD